MGKKVADKLDRLKTRLPPQSLVAQRIFAHYSDMSAALRQFADFVLVDPLTLARMSIHDAVKAVGVSVATANRFATAIGFSGYADFRAELIRSFETLFGPAQRLKEKLAEESTPLEVMIASMREDIANLESTIQNLSTSQVDRAVDMILEAEKVYIAGFDIAGSLGNVLGIGLEQIGKTVLSAENGGSVVGAGRQLFKLGPKDLVISIGFSFYIRDTLVVTHHARRQGVPVLAITDKLNSPLAGMSDLALFVEAHHDFNPPSDTAIMGLIEALVAAVASRTPDAAEIVERFAAFIHPWMISTPGDWSPDDT